MKKQILLVALSIGINAAVGAVANAEDVKAPAAPALPVESKVEAQTTENPSAVKAMQTPAPADHKKEWSTLSKQEKVKRLEEKRAANRKKSDEKWAKMSDDEKIAKAEKRHENMKKMRESRKAKVAKSSNLPAAQAGAAVTTPTPSAPAAAPVTH